jgi:hypothetical protein
VRDRRRRDGRSRKGKARVLSTELTRAGFLKKASLITLIGTTTGAALLATGCNPPTKKTNRAEGSPEGSPNNPNPHNDETTQLSPTSLVQHFRSREDLKPPTIEVITHKQSSSSSGAAAEGAQGEGGYIFCAPKNGPDESSPSQDGAMIFDNRGDLVWFWPLESEEQDVMDFKVQSYLGEDVLTFWVGTHTGYGKGEYIILDSSYEEVGRVRAANGYAGDHHEFLITPQNTALITIYGEVDSFDLSSMGGSKEGKVLDGIVQELDIESGELLFEWHSLEHVDLKESYGKVPKKSEKWYFDYFHINSIEVDHDSNLLISARKTSTIYKLDRQSGDVIWRLGGKKSDFKMNSGSTTAYQHDARRQEDGTITVFDNGDFEQDDQQSYGLVLEVDEEKMSATLLEEYPNPEGKLCATQGSMQVLPQRETVFIGWGSNPLMSEFSREGELLFSASFPPEVESYRAFRFPWRGQPARERPALVAERVGEEGLVRAYASWNGATEVASWELLAGSDPRRMNPVGEVPREGFETAIEVRTSEPYVGVRARDASGRVLGTSRAIKPGN